MNEEQTAWSWIYALLPIAGVIAYFVIATFASWKMFLVTEKYAHRWQRKAMVSLTLAVFFAPSILVGNHGGWGIGPAIVSIIQQVADTGPVNPRTILKVGIAPIITSFFAFFALGSIVFRSGRKNAINGADPIDRSVEGRKQAVQVKKGTDLFFSQPSYSSAEFSEFAVNRTIDGIDRIVLIGLVRNEFGQWQVDSM